MTTHQLPGTGAARHGTEAVDAAFADPEGDGLAGAVDELVTTLHGHLAHEERDALPLIGTALTAGEWRAVGVRMGRANGISGSSEFFAWMLDGIPADEVAAVLAELPAPLRLVYRLAWQPRYSKVTRW